MDQINNIMIEIILPFIVSGIAIVYGCWHFIVRPYLQHKKPFADLPMPENSHWLTGHMNYIYGDLDQTQKKLVDASDEYGRTGYWVGPKRWIAVSRWQDARAILNAESWKDMNPIGAKRLNALIPNSILLINGVEWKHNRAAINKSFTPAGLEASTQAIVDVTETVSTTLKQRIVAANDQCYQTEIEPLMKMITIDVFAKATFSQDFGCTKNLQNNEFAAAFDSLGKCRTEFLKAKQTIHSYVESMIEDREKGEGTKKKDLLSDIIDANNKHNNKHNDKGKSDDNNKKEMLRDVVATVLFAGFDTTSITLTYALYMLSQHPDVAAKCLEEIESIASLKEGHGDLVYCQAVIQETLRLFPPAAQNERTLKKPVKLPGNGYVVPAGTGVMVPIWSLHRDERNFSRPLEFLPERWVCRRFSNSRDEVGEAAARWVERDPTSETTECGDIPAGNPKSLLAFSGGGRNCPGMKFARQEAVIVLAGLVKEFNFATLPGYELRVERGGFIQHPESLPMKITLRHQQE